MLKRSRKRLSSICEINAEIAPDLDQAAPIAARVRAALCGRGRDASRCRCVSPSFELFAPSAEAMTRRYRDSSR